MFRCVKRVLRKKHVFGLFCTWYIRSELAENGKNGPNKDFWTLFLSFSVVYVRNGLILGGWITVQIYVDASKGF